MEPGKLKVVELREELKKRGLDTKGLKAVIVKRLQEAIESQEQNNVQTNLPSPIVQQSNEIPFTGSDKNEFTDQKSIVTTSSASTVVDDLLSTELTTNTSNTPNELSINMEETNKQSMQKTNRTRFDQSSDGVMLKKCVNKIVEGEEITFSEKNDKKEENHQMQQMKNFEEKKDALDEFISDKHDEEMFEDNMPSQNNNLIGDSTEEEPRIGENQDKNELINKKRSSENHQLGLSSSNSPNKDNRKLQKFQGDISQSRVPPSKKQPTNTLLVENFVRPFTLQQVKELMGSVSGEDSIVEFWMNKIKTHCYATYKTVDQAIATRQEIHHLIWPAHCKKLVADFVPQHVAERQIAGENNPRSPRKQPNTQSAQPAQNNNTLEKLFKKSDAKPHIYWMTASKETIERNKSRGPRFYTRYQ